MPEGIGGPAVEPSAPRSDGRDRLIRALRQPARSQIAVAVILSLVGFAGVTQVRAVEVDDSFAGQRQQDLIDILDGLAGTTQRAESEIERLEQTREELLSKSSQRQAALEQAQSEADALSVLAGRVPVTGPGIRATITEDTGRIRISTLLDIVQEVRTVGAEAIEFNAEVRVVAQTSFEEAADGDGIEVGGVRLNAPYVIAVIGEPVSLARAMDFLDGPQEQVREDGGTMEVQSLPALDIKSIAASPQPEYAEPDVGQ